MTWQLFWSKAAQADLLDIWLYIAADNPEAADRLISRIEKAVDRLSDFPQSGPARHDIGPNVRGIVMNHHLVLYRLLPEQRRIELIRVIDGRRDLAALFSTGEP